MSSASRRARAGVRRLRILGVEVLDAFHAQQKLVRMGLALVTSDGFRNEGIRASSVADLVKPLRR